MEVLDMKSVEQALPDKGNLAFEDFGKKTRKQSRKKVPFQENGGKYDGSADDNCYDYSYQNLLTRLYEIIEENNSNDNIMFDKKKFVVQTPQVIKIGTKKTAFINFSEIASTIHRKPLHLLAFLSAELGTTGTIDGNNKLILKGKFLQKHLEHVLRKYIMVIY